MTDTTELDESAQDWEESIRTARAILDPDEPPRALYVGLFHLNGTDYSMGVNNAVVLSEGETSERAAAEVLASHLSALAEEYEYSVEEFADWGVKIANE